jgi:hypothetical protein
MKICYNKIMKILFCENILRPNSVDEAYLDEYKYAINNGFEVLLYNYEEKSIKNIKPSEKMETIIYRGWMITPENYELLYNELFQINYRLINNPTEYRNCHYLPDSLKYIENYTPKTIFQKYENDESISILLDKTKIFNGKAVIVKDYVKSEKYYWDTACYVECSDNIQKLTETINNFIELREGFLNEGIVIREYIELNNIQKHSKCSMPLSEEYRLFFYKNELLCIYNYWEEILYNLEKPEFRDFELIGKNIESNFFTMDIAKDKKCNYFIIELGDGQVSGIPENEDKNILYKKIKEKQTSA